MSDQLGPIEGDLPVEIVTMKDGGGDTGLIAKQVIKFAKIIDELNARVAALEKELGSDR
ncbi:MAG: hypothetical protein QGF59_12200 [Pirellulaceae bacterium]|jgi:hypothetical protein|nr:hypothetical protein [Pirellulaceae bacterium]MDP6719409.1 hypothetical protein [Pirellulaceae bacterium]